MDHELDIRLDVTLQATPEQVWDAIATTTGLAAWFMPVPVDATDAGTEVWEPGKHLLIRTPAGPDGSSQAFEYVIEAGAGGTTVLRFSHSGFLGDDWSDEYEAMTRAGWGMYLATLAEYFVHFAGQSATYIEAEAPPSSARAEAWPALGAALRPDGPLTVGATVRITGGVATEDGQPIVATIDLVDDRFVGLRTADALIRFHGRWLMGMSVAVSHHAYGEIDAPMATQRWAGWLASVFPADP